MNGCHSDGTTKNEPITMMASTTPTLMATITPLTRDDSRMPITRSVVAASDTRMAGTLTSAVTVEPSARVMTVPGAATNRAGSGIPMSWNSDTTYADQPTATVAAPSAYSRTRSQPIIHATSSPSVA